MRVSHDLGEVKSNFAAILYKLDRLMNIDKKMLLKYIEHNQIGFQFWDELQEFTKSDGFYDEMGVKYGIHEKVVRLNTTIKESKQIKVITADEIMKDPNDVFYDFAKWTGGKGLFLLVDEEPLICISWCHKDMFIAKAV